MFPRGPGYTVAVNCPLFGLPGGKLAKGAPADLIRFDPDEPFVVDAARLRSRSKNTPFDGARLEGVVKTTMVAGAIVGAQAQ